MKPGRSGKALLNVLSGKMFQEIGFSPTTGDLGDWIKKQRVCGFAFSQ